MKKGKKYKLINIYIPFLILGIIFIFVLKGILSTEYIDDTEKFTNEYEEINKIPSTEKDIDSFKYNIYVVKEPVSVYALAEKLKIDPNIILYNNPYVIGKEVLQEGDRIVLYDVPIIFYRIGETDTIEKIIERFGVKSDELFKMNSELVNTGIQYKKYLIINNPLITEATLRELRKETTYENVAYNLNNQIKLEEEEKTQLALRNQSSKTTRMQEQQNNNDFNKNFENTNTGIKNSSKNNKTILGNDSKDSNQKVVPEKNQKTGNEINKYMLWPISSTNITSGFGNRNHPILKTKKFHRGLDISASKGTQLKASFTGVVTYAATKGGYGNLVEIERADGIRVRYAHLDKISVSKGDSVKEGQIIGATGNTGLSTGPHLHFEILVNGEPVDPRGWNYY